METFLNWVENKGVVTKASVKQTQYAGFGLFATKDVSDTVVHIPKELLLTCNHVLFKNDTFSNTVFDCLSRRYNIEKELTKHQEKIVLCLFVIYCQLVETEYQPYMDILPTLYFFKENHVLFNTDCIQGTSLEKSVRAKLASLERELIELQRAVQHNWIADISLEQYLWADCVFWSRVVGIGEQDSTTTMALIPFFDFANHASKEANMRWQLSPEGLDLVTYPDQTVVKEGVELLLSYGSKPNQELLFLHGFCIPDNPEPSCVTLSIAPFLSPEMDPINIPKMKWLQRVGAKPTLQLFQKTIDHPQDLMDCGWTMESIAIMYFVVLDEDDGITFDQEGNFYMAGKEVSCIKKVEERVHAMDILPVLKLRIITLLMDALKYHHSIISQYDKESDRSIEIQALIYRQEETLTLASSIQSLDELGDTLMNDPVVISYLG